MEIYCTHITNDGAEEHAAYLASADTVMHLCKACVDGLREKFQEELAGIVDYRLEKNFTDAMRGK